MANDRKTDLIFLPLGGAGEIGMNLYLYGTGGERRRRWLMVDCGVKFGDAAEPGIDLVLPDVSYIAAEHSNLCGIVITHGHEDHIGALAWLWPQLRVPVYATPFAAELLKRKLGEAGLLGDVDLRVMALGSRFDAGPFNVEYVAVTHSIPEPAALAIRTDAGMVVHSGDWKIDMTPSIPPDLDVSKLKELGAEGVRALVCDSTNVLREGHSPSERDVAAGLEAVIASAKKRVAVTTFASHVGRIASIVQCARKAGREIVVAGRAMQTILAAARETGLLKDAGTFLDQDSFGYLPRDKVLLLCTGSQGEPRAAVARIAQGNHPQIALDPGDLVVFSSKTIPGNEKSVAQVLNNLAGQGIETITSDEAMIHSSGHPRQGELADMYDWLKPDVLVPMHGEMRHLVHHAAFARERGIGDSIVARNGDVVRLAPGPLEIIDAAPSGQLHVDGKVQVPAIDGPARFRRKLSYVGVVCVSVALDHKGNLVSEAQVITDGLPETGLDGESLDDTLVDLIDDQLDQLPRARRRTDEAVIEALRNAVRRGAEAAWGKRPICHVVVHRL